MTEFTATKLYNPIDTRLHWLDVMRFIVMFMMIMSHACDAFNYATPGPGISKDTINWWGAFWGSGLRPCVPIFVMMTAVLLLPIKTNMTSFYKKRIPRVLFPFLVWSVLYNLFPWIVYSCGGGTPEVNAIFPYASNVTGDFSSALKMCALIPVNFSMYAVHMWYVYLIIGLYLFMPIFSAWLERATKREKEIVLLIWGVTLFLPYVQALTGMQLWGACSWNNYPMLYNFSGFIGYLLLGHYLVTYNKMGWKKTLLIAIPSFIIGYLITFIGFRHMWAIPNVTEPEIELFWTFCSINVLLETVALFIVVQKVRINYNWINTLLADMAKYSFGIYLSHYFVVGAVTVVLNYLPIFTGIRLPVVAFFAYFITYIIIKMLAKIPKSKYFIG